VLLYIDTCLSSEMTHAVGFTKNLHAKIPIIYCC